MKKKNILLIIVSIGVSILFIGLTVLSNIYYSNHSSSLGCVHLIGPMFGGICEYQVGLEKIILMYKIIKLFHNIIR